MVDNKSEGSYGWYQSGAHSHYDDRHRRPSRYHCDCPEDSDSDSDDDGPGIGGPPSISGDCNCEQLEDRIEDLEDRVDELEEDLDDLDAFIDDLFDELDEVTDEFLELREFASELENRQDDLEDFLDEIEENTVDNVLDSIEDQGFLAISDRWIIGELDNGSEDFIIFDSLDDGVYRFE